jgi:hypothetical protein
MQTGLGDPEILRDLTDGRVALAGDGDHVPAELFGNGFGIANIPPP